VDPVKIAVFLAAFGLLLVIGRALSRASETHVALSLPRRSGTETPSGEPSPTSDRDPDPSALIGAEFGMPIPLPPVQRMATGGFNRPIFTNYYFAKTDLVSGPADPACFCDEFFLQMQDPESQHRWTTEFTIATPAGLRQVLDEGKFGSVYFETPVVIVSQWDLPLILHTVTEEATKIYRYNNGGGENPASSGTEQ